MVIGSGYQNKRLQSLRMVCISCQKENDFRIEKETLKTILVIIPFWSTEYFATCSNCQSTFQLNREKAKQVEQQLKSGKLADWADGRIPNLKEFIDEKDYKKFLDNDGIKL